MFELTLHESREFKIVYQCSTPDVLLRYLLTLFQTHFPFDIHLFCFRIFFYFFVFCFSYVVTTFLCCSTGSCIHCTHCWSTHRSQIVEPREEKKKKRGDVLWFLFRRCGQNANDNFRNCCCARYKWIRLRYLDGNLKQCAVRWNWDKNRVYSFVQCAVENIFSIFRCCCCCISSFFFRISRLLFDGMYA